MSQNYRSSVLHRLKYRFGILKQRGQKAYHIWIFWLINTARGTSVVTKDLVKALKSGKVLGAGLDVLEYEKSSFEDLFSNNKMPEAFKYLINADNVILSPHVAGWTIESKEKLAQTIVDKIKDIFS